MAQRSLRFAVSLLVPSLLLASGCGQAAGTMPPAGASARISHGANARAVAPDDPAVLTDDTRHATYWQGDAQLIMSVHTTAMNTTKISSSANVYFSLGAATDPDNNPQGNLFVARHYFTPFLAQFNVQRDYNKLITDMMLNQHTLVAIGAYNVTATQAFQIARTYNVVPSPAPTGSPLPPVLPPITARAAGSIGLPGASRHLAAIPAPYVPTRVFASTRAILTQPAGQNPQWALYGDHQKYLIDAVTAQVLSVTPRIDPNDQLNTGTEVDLQRASSAWLPVNPFFNDGQAAPQTPVAGS